MVKTRFIKSLKAIIRKFTLLDILVVILALSIFGYLLTKRVTQKVEWVDVRLKLGASEWWWDTANPDYWFVANLKAGDKAYSSLGDRIADLRKIEIYDDNEGRKVVYVTLGLSASYDESKGLYIFNYQPLQIGKPIDLNFSGGNVRGLIIDIGEVEPQYTLKNVEMRIENIFPEIALSYQTGLQSKDNNGETVAVIDSVKTEDSKVYELIDTRYNRINIINPFTNRKDVILKMRLKVFESGGEMYFVNGETLKIGQFMNIYFTGTAIKDAKITKIN